VLLRIASEEMIVTLSGTSTTRSSKRVAVTITGSLLDSGKSAAAAHEPAPASTAMTDDVNFT
jgi:hypothetical protein